MTQSRAHRCAACQNGTVRIHGDRQDCAVCFGTGWVPDFVRKIQHRKYLWRIEQGDPYPQDAYTQVRSENFKEKQ